MATAAALSSFAVPQPLDAQRGPIVRSVSIVTSNIFDAEQAKGSFLFRAANAIHVTTRPSLVRSELLFREGDRLDSARLAESVRNLRARRLFRDVAIDTVMVGDSVDVTVRTADGWTTELVMNAAVTDGQFTWALGGQERNFLGTGARVGLVFRDEPDRSAWTLRAGHDRIGGTRFGVDGAYDRLSDGQVGLWRVGVPFRSLPDRAGIDLFGMAADRRVLQFRDGVINQAYRRRAFAQQARAAVAPVASSHGYLRVGVAGIIKNEEYFLEADTATVIPDSVSAAFAAVGEVMDARFKVVTHYNGFAREVDIDLSTRVTLEAWAALRAFGYERNGIGPLLSVQTGFDGGKVFGVFAARVNGLLTSSGVDSGQVVGAVTLAAQLIPKNATVFHMEAGATRGLPPGSEYDLGHGVGPRGFRAHSFTGNRVVWGSLEQRAFLVDEVLGLLGIGFAAFVDYGGAWYSDQARRIGGNVGLGLRIGATRSSGANVGRIDLAYRFGDGAPGRRWAVSFGRGFSF